MSDDGTSVRAAPEHGRWATRLAAVAILALGAVALYDAIRISARDGFAPQQAGFFPAIVAVGLLAFGGAFLLRTTAWVDTDLRRRVAEYRSTMHWPTLTPLGATLLVYAFVLDPLGYILATVLFFVTTARVVGSRKPVRDLAIGAVASVAIYIGFTELLGVRLPAGLLAPIL